MRRSTRSVADRTLRKFGDFIPRHIVGNLPRPADEAGRERWGRPPAGDLPISTLPVEQTEGPERCARRHIGEVGIAGALRIHAADAGDDGDVLLAVLFPGDGLPDNPR